MRAEPGFPERLNLRVADVIRTREIMEGRLAVAVETLRVLERAAADR